MRFFTSCGFSCTSKPAIVALPAVGGRKQVRTRIVVVFPAPLGPRKPTIWPFSTSKEMSSTATVRAYRLVRPSTLIILMIQTRETSEVAFWQRKGASVLAPIGYLNFHHKEGEEQLSTRGGGTPLLRVLKVLKIVHQSADKFPEEFIARDAGRTLVRHCAALVGHLVEPHPGRRARGLAR